VKQSHFLTLVLVLFTFNSHVLAEDFFTDRLPLGDPDRKYDFCKVSLDKIRDTRQNKDVSLKEMIEALKSYRIVMIGETHTNQTHHDVQFEVIKGLVEAGKPVVFALEMFNPDQDEALAKWSSGTTDADTFLKQTDYLRTWSHNYRYYQAIFEFAREKHLPIYGANVERKYASKIGKKGIAGLTDEERAVLPEIHTSHLEHRFFIKTAMQGLDALMPAMFPSIYEAQCLWDTAMGEGAIRVAKAHPNAVVIVLAGSGHVDYNIGIGRIIAERSDLPFASVIPVDVEQEEEDLSGMAMVKSSKDKTEKAEKPEMAHPHSMPAANENPHGGSEDQAKNEEGSKSNMHMSHAAHGMGAMDATPYHIVSRSLGDFLWGKPAMEQELYPSFGFSFDSEAEGFVLKRVLPHTLAFEHGFKKDDQFLSLDGATFDSMFDIKKYLHYKNWGESLAVRLKRGEEELEIQFKIEPLEEDE